MDEFQPLQILHQFGVSGPGIRLERLTQGLINDTFRVHNPEGDALVLQRINRSVFPDPESLMDNLERVLPALKGAGYQSLELLKYSEERRFLIDSEGSLWRIFLYIPHSKSYENPANPEMAREAGRIVATFHRLVSEISPDDLHTTLPGFHDIEKRYAQLQTSLQEADADRLTETDSLLKQAESLYAFCRQIPFADLPLRVCHNDTKLSNILFDTRTGKALCLIDLDTLMPGNLLFDFGDTARGMLFPETNSGIIPAKGKADLQLFENYLKGWKEGGLEMQPFELQWLCHGVVLMPALHGIRALSDYLSGDRYYKVAYPKQNRDRAERLLGTADSARRTLDQMQQRVENLLS